MERSKAGTAYRQPNPNRPPNHNLTDGLTQPNQNTIIINIIVVFYKIWKKTIKFKKQNGLANHSSSPANQKLQIILPPPTAQVRMRNDLPHHVFDTGMLDGFKGAVNLWLIPRVVFSSVFRGAGA